MLQSITIRQLALIDETTICFHHGLQVLTGETGAGKSIVVDAVNLILGSRSDRSIIRSGSEKASVEAVFSLDDNQIVSEFLRKEEIDPEGDTLTIYRELAISGKNSCRVCGVLIPLAKLKMLASLLMDIHGQNDQQFLLDPEIQMAFLDGTGEGSHRDLLNRIRDEQSAFMQNHREYASLIKKSEGQETKKEALKKDIELLKKARIQTGEAAALRTEKNALNEKSLNYANLKTAEELIASGEDGSALQKIRNAADMLKKSAEKDPEMLQLSERCESLFLELEELAFEISSRSENMSFDPVRLERIEKRLELITRIEYRFSRDADRIGDRLKELEKEYAELDGLNERISQMAAEHKRLLQRYRSTAKELTVSRENLASGLETRMMSELNDLGMKGTLFSVRFSKPEDGKPRMPSQNGDDRIEFMISPNPGEPLRPLAAIASGGELSRLMLAFKTLEAAHTGVGSMVFDEIDTGISGQMAQVVAEKMISISRGKQVICVTHLPQIAAAADNQYLVSKGMAGERTITKVSELGPDERSREIARMISGADGISDESVRYASGMLTSADRIKNTGKPKEK